MTELAVDLYGTRVGMLSEGRGGFDFHADPDAVARYGAGSGILSFAVPLVSRPRPGDAPLRRNFFDEVLPEGRARARLAGNARLAPDYTVGMLARYGRDVAGALTIWDPMAPGEPRTPTSQLADATRVRHLLEQVRSDPLGNDSLRRMSSLAGVQDKIVLARTDEGWAEPLDGYPSTHILKPVVPAYPSLIFDEEYGARIARELGLAAFDTWIEHFDGIAALVIQRYDRDAASPDGRLHQEDFNQVLGMSGDAKYEDHGHPGLAAIARVLRDRIDRSAMEQLLRLTTMSVAVGNLDMHAKNISVLHLPDDRARLAPAYDIVPQTHLPVDQQFAFAIDGVSHHSAITFGNLVNEGVRWGVRDAADVVESVLVGVRHAVATARPLPGAHFSLAEDIDRIARHILESRGREDAPVAAPRQSPGRYPNNAGGWGGPVRR